MKWKFQSGRYRQGQASSERENRETNGSAVEALANAAGEEAGRRGPRVTVSVNGH